MSPPSMDEYNISLDKFFVKFLYVKGLVKGKERMRKGELKGVGEIICTLKLGQEALPKDRQT